MNPFDFMDKFLKSACYIKHKGDGFLRRLFFTFSLLGYHYRIFDIAVCGGVEGVAVFVVSDGDFYADCDGVVRRGRGDVLVAEACKNIHGRALGNRQVVDHHVWQVAGVAEIMVIPAARNEGHRAACVLQRDILQDDFAVPRAAVVATQTDRTVAVYHGVLNTQIARTDCRNARVTDLGIDDCRVIHTLVCIKTRQRAAVIGQVLAVVRAHNTPQLLVVDAVRLRAVLPGNLVRVACRNVICSHRIRAVGRKPVSLVTGVNNILKQHIVRTRHGKEAVVGGTRVALARDKVLQSRHRYIRTGN